MPGSLVIVNPHASQARDDGARQALIQQLQAVLASRDSVAALVDTHVPLGIIPAGTGNQVVAVLGIPLALDRAAEALSSEQARTIDLGEVTLHLDDGTEARSIFIIGCGAGFDAGGF